MFSFLRRLPVPECQLGYPDSQLHDILGTRYEEFMSWMHGQTMTICDGKVFDYDTNKYLSTGCGPHGTVVYYWDVDQFLAGRSPLD